MADGLAANTNRVEASAYAQRPVRQSSSRKECVERVVRGHGGRGRVAFERFGGGTAELEYLTFETKTAGLPYMASVIWPVEQRAAVTVRIP